MVKANLNKQLIVCTLLGCAAAFGVQSAQAAEVQDLARAEEARYASVDACYLAPEAVDVKAFRAAYRDVEDKQEWLTLVDTKYSLSAKYKPHDLTGSGRILLRKEAMAQMEKMQEAARKDGVIQRPISTYRSYEYQAGLVRRTKNPSYVAAPGHSQHQLGTAIDFNTVDPADENIPALKWLRKHAGEYGFSLSFPKGQEAETGYPYEAWHYRYITKEGVYLQDTFFGGSQHKMLRFLQMCLWPAEERVLAQNQVRQSLRHLPAPQTAAPTK